MSQKLGPRTFGKKEEMVFLGREISEQRDYSDKVAEEIDDEVRELILSGYATATDLLIRYKDKLKEIADYLVVNETVEGKDLEDLLNVQTPSLDSIGDT